MRRSAAQYLLRCDDLCPTMVSERWQRMQALIVRYQVKPILAVIPDNQDPSLNFASPDPDFWKKMRNLQAIGATIALHGFRHKCTLSGRSMIPLHRETEFAGAPEDQQREWIHEGVKILRSHGLNPRLFVAPRHGFDRSTLRALLDEGIPALSDGFASRPFLRAGMLWLPQQHWAPVKKQSGLWTICMHSNTASNHQMEELEAFLEGNAAHFTSYDQVNVEYKQSQLNLIEAMSASALLWRTKLHMLKNF